MKFRNARVADIEEMKQLYVETIESVCKRDYDELQRSTWSAGIHNAVMAL